MGQLDLFFKVYFIKLRAEKVLLGNFLRSCFAAKSFARQTKKSFKASLE